MTSKTIKVYHAFDHIRLYYERLALGMSEAGYKQPSDRFHAMSDYYFRLCWYAMREPTTITNTVRDEETTR